MIGKKGFTIVNNVYGGIKITDSGLSVLIEGGVTFGRVLLTWWYKTVGKC